MKPTYEEITEINPGLKNRPREEVVKLIEAILSKGYIWDDKKKYFYNEKIGMHVRTQGLDLFDPERFERAYQTWSNPKYARGGFLRSKIYPKTACFIYFRFSSGMAFYSNENLGHNLIYSFGSNNCYKENC